MYFQPHNVKIKGEKGSHPVIAMELKKEFVKVINTQDKRNLSIDPKYANMAQFGGNEEDDDSDGIIEEEAQATQVDIMILIINSNTKSYEWKTHLEVVPIYTFPD